MQVAQVAPGAGENPEMSRRGAFAAGGLALAALVAGGCGWLAMNAVEGTKPNGGKLLVTSLSSKDLTKNVAAIAATDSAAELEELGLSTFQTSFGQKDTIQALTGDEVRQSKNPVYATFSFANLSAGSPYLLRATVYRPTYEPVEDTEGNPGALNFAKVVNGKAYRIASKETVGTYSVACIPSAPEGFLSVPLSLDDDSEDLYAKGSLTYMGQC